MMMIIVINIYLFSGPSNTEYGVLLLGILIMQDVVLGLFIAFLPIMADPISNPHLAPAAVYTLIIVQLISGMALSLCLCVYVCTYVRNRTVFVVYFMKTDTVT